jgi:uncharacterized membrane protein YbaN (DUF454 family)
MKQKLKMASLRLLGALILLGGILGLFLPFLQGVAMIILGVYLLTLGHPTAHTHIRKRLYRAPSLVRMLDSIDDRVRRWLGLPPREE